MCQKHLCTAQAIFSQLGFIDVGQTHLTHGRRGLKLVDGLGSALPTQAFHALCNGTRRDHDQLSWWRIPVPFDEERHLTTPLPNRLLIQATPLIGDQARADFDHQPASVFER